MHRSPIRSSIRPKISTMPRQQSEAAAFLDIYKLTVEKKRLQQELATIEQRRERICQRLAVLENQVNQLEQTVDTLRQSEVPPVEGSEATPPAAKPSSFSTFTLDY